MCVCVGHAQVILGTESGMITAIVRRVQLMLQAAGRSDVDVEVVFPVASDAITTRDQLQDTLPDLDVMTHEVSAGPSLPGGLAIVPGPAAGEGCSTEGGCASCPYMKMNSLQCAPPSPQQQWTAVLKRTASPDSRESEHRTPCFSIHWWHWDGVVGPSCMVSWGISEGCIGTLNSAE